MSKILKFKVVDKPPTGPREAYWDGFSWQVTDASCCYYSVGGMEEDAQEENTPGGGIDNATLLKAIALSQKPELITDIL